MKENTKSLLKGLGIGFGVLSGIAILSFILKKGGNKIVPSLTNLSKSPCSHLASCDLPQASKAENNLKNIGLLIDNNIPFIELDIQITKDRVPVLFHDNTLDKKTNGSGSISSKNWSELKNIRYKSDSTQGITKLEDAIRLLKKSNKGIYFQFDKCSPSEIKIINDSGILKGVENNIICKNIGFYANPEYVNAGVKYMPMIPSGYVGKMSSMSVINEIVEKCKGFDFCELSFGTSDKLVLDGTLAKKLNEIGCSLFGVAITGVTTTNPNYYDKSWGDKETAWKKYFDQIGCNVLMTDKPIAMRKFLDK
jgi:hypothetical protein